MINSLVHCQVHPTLHMWWPRDDSNQLNSEKWNGRFGNHTDETLIRSGSHWSYNPSSHWSYNPSSSLSIWGDKKRTLIGFSKPYDFFFSFFLVNKWNGTVRLYHKVRLWTLYHKWLVLVLHTCSLLYVGKWSLRSDKEYRGF